MPDNLHPVPDPVIHLMRTEGSDFASALAECYVHADSAKKAKLIGAFGADFREHERLYERHQSAAIRLMGLCIRGSEVGR